MNKIVTLFVPLRARKGKGDLLEQRIAELVKIVRKEEGNICYRSLRSSEDSDSFAFFEQWESQAALDKHNQQPHLTEFAADKDGLIDGEITDMFFNEFAADTF